jgi:hypothetical protein
MNPNDVLIYIGELSFENRSLRALVDQLRQETEQLKAQIPAPATAEAPPTPAAVPAA